MPFMRILEDEDDKAKLIQSLHLTPKPGYSKTSSRYAHETESKAFAMSSLINNTGVFFQCMSLAIL
jgi:hypothetical protein